MQVNFGDGVSIGNMQVGDNNTMNAQTVNSQRLLGESDWSELGNFLERRLAESTEKDVYKPMIENTLSYVNHRDENGLKGFIKRNKESFFTNVMSDVASSGLILLLSRLIL